MSNQTSFRAVSEKNLETLEQYVPIVAKVHGEHHPEFHKVRKIFDALRQKIKEAGAGKPDLEGEFVALRKITGDYTVPGDTCETYAAVYNKLGEMDKAYHAEA